MFYRVTATIAFTIEDEARDFYHDCEVALPKGATINPDQENAEPGFIMLEECFHDESPAIPCKTLKTESSAPAP